MDTTRPLDGTFHLTQAVARSMGVNLTAMVAEGHLTSADLEKMFTKCHGCIDHGACVAWLARGRWNAKQPPEYCVNKAVLERLARVAS